MTELRHRPGLASSEEGFVAAAFGGGSSSAFQPWFERGAPSSGFAALTSAGSAQAKSSSAAPVPSPEETLAQVRQEAARLLADAEATARIRIEKAVADAVAAARNEQVTAFTQAAETLLKDVRRASDAKLEQVERDAAGLVVTLARRVLHDHFAADETAILSLVREALRPLSDSLRVQVVIAPMHEAAVREAQGQLAQTLRDGAHLEIIVSDTEAAFGCLAHGEQSSVDARLENRLDALQRAVEQTLVSDAA